MRLPARLGLTATALLLAVPFLAISAPRATAIATTDTLTSGSTLAAGQSLYSANGRYQAMMQTDGNFVVYRSNGSPIWSTSTSGSGATEIAMQTDGNLVVYSPARALWSTGTEPSTGDELVLQDDGNLVVYTGSGQPLWSIRTGRVAAAKVRVAPSPPVQLSALATAHTLSSGQALTASNGAYRAVLQGDGNLVVERASGVATWSTNTAGSGATALVMQSDGNLVLYATRGPVWASNTTPTSGDQLVMQGDGNLVVYDAAGQPVWSSLAGATGVRQDTLSAGHGLNAGQALLSASGGYEALMQTDGNFVVYRTGAAAAWSTGTSGAGGLVMMQTDGNLVVYVAGQPLWSSVTPSIGATRVVLQNDGTLAIYNGLNQVLWSTPGYGPGPNAYLCSTTGYSCDNTGYTGQAVWDFAGPHNCTDYVAWRLALRGVPHPGNLGNGGDWSSRARSFGLTVNQTPSVGAVAAYDYGSEWAPADGHVGYVIQVGVGYIIIAEDNFPGSQPGHLDVRRALPGTNWWPSSFIHF